MKEITLKVPEEKVRFFKQLAKELGFEVTEETHIPEGHKSIVRDRIKTAKTDEMEPWEEARKKFAFKS